jgi:ABC-type transport system substrate-binding protein
MLSPRIRLVSAVSSATQAEAVAGDTPWTTCYSFSVCGSQLGTEAGSEGNRTPDIAKARQLLAEAGYMGEKVVIIGTPQLPIIGAMSQVMAQRLRDAGVNVDLQMGDWATIYQRMNTRNLAMDKGGWNVAANYSMGGTAAGLNYRACRSRPPRWASSNAAAGSMSSAVMPEATSIATFTRFTIRKPRIGASGRQFPLRAII